MVKALLVFLNGLVALSVANAARRAPWGKFLKDQETSGDVDYAVVVSVTQAGLCSGSILSETYVLTAAHCVQDAPPRHITIHYDMGADMENSIRVKSVKIHPYYTKELPLKNNLAILELENSIPLGNGIGAVTLPELYEPTAANATAILAGFGHSHHFGRMVKKLHVGKLRVYPDEECEKIYDIVDKEYHICASGQYGTKATCKGDQGAPLAVNGVQIGLVSWGPSVCGDPNVTGVFSKLSSNVAWIKYMIGNKNVEPSFYDDCDCECGCP